MNGVASPASCAKQPILRGFVSWYSSTSTCAQRACQRASASASRSSNVDRQRDQVVEIHGPVSAKRVARTARTHAPPRRRPRSLRRGERLLRRDERVLPAADQPLRLARTRTVGGGDELGDHAARHRLGSKIEKARGNPSAAFASARTIESPSAWNVEIASCLRVPGLALAREQRLRALAHFARRLVRERDRDDARRIGATFDQVRDLGRDHARLAAARAGQHEQRAVDVAHGVALRRIERKDMHDYARIDADSNNRTNPKDRRFMALYAIGDIQGCHAEFCQLLDLIGFSSREDRLWLVGDSSIAGRSRSPCCARSSRSAMPRSPSSATTISIC